MLSLPQLMTLPLRDSLALLGIEIDRTKGARFGRAKTLRDAKTGENLGRFDYGEALDLCRTRIDRAGSSRAPE